MDVVEFSNEFDTLLNSFAIKADFGSPNTSIELDEYEKSVYLTQALELIIIEAYRGNEELEGFEATEENRRYLNPLVKTAELITPLTNRIALDKRSKFYGLPKDVWLITYEAVLSLDENLDCYKGKNLMVYPVTLDEYNRIRENPFRGVSEKRVLRLDSDDNSVELISNYSIDKYIIRYLTKPLPIILEDLPESISIDNKRNKNECMLNPILHKAILDRAVMLALRGKHLLLGSNN